MEALDRLGPPPPPGPTAKKAEPLEGRADGDPAGDALRAEEGDRYLALVQKALRDGYVLPTTISAQELLRLSCEVFIRIAADGRISQARIQAPSGNAQFDRAIESALARLTLPPPPKGFLERYPDGLAIRYKP
jgi:colicin import membrane protein/protein TonB